MKNYFNIKVFYCFFFKGFKRGIILKIHSIISFSIFINISLCKIKHKYNIHYLHLIICEFIDILAHVTKKFQHALKMYVYTFKILRFSRKKTNKTFSQLLYLI